MDPGTGHEKRECVLDFGFVQTNAKAVASVVFENLGTIDVKVSGWSLEQDPAMGEAFTLDELTLPATVTVPAGQAVDLPVAFAPLLLGGHEGKLIFTTTGQARLPAGYCLLWGTGGGPVVDVQPGGPIDLGTVNGSVNGVLTIANIGTQITGTTDDSLKLAAPDPATTCAGRAQCPGGFCLRGHCWSEKKVEIEVVEGDPAEFTLQWPPSGYDASGIPAGESIDVKYQFAPAGPGARKANLRIHSNDPARPLVVIEVSGSGV
ncbi:MAG TPA: hypothetical protein VGK67_30200 [Myxococcales bacterium]